MNFTIRQETFEGPLELLLELIEKERLSISEISLAQVTNEYLAYIKSLEKINPVEIAEFLVVAAQLILIKSRSLLPSLQLSEEEEQSIDELESRLGEYRILRELSKEIKKLMGNGVKIATRESYAQYRPVFYPPPSISSRKIADSFAAFLAAIPKVEKLAKETIKRVISLQERIQQIQAGLQNRVEKAFSEIVGGSAEKMEIIISFLAILELAKQKIIDVDQENLFEEIKIRTMNPESSNIVSS